MRHSGWRLTRPPQAPCSFGKAWIKMMSIGCCCTSAVGGPRIQLSTCLKLLWSANADSTRLIGPFARRRYEPLICGYWHLRFAQPVPQCPL